MPLIPVPNPHVVQGSNVLASKLGQLLLPVFGYRLIVIVSLHLIASKIKDNVITTTEGVAMPNRQTPKS